MNLTCLICAVLFFVGNILSTAVIVKWYRNFDWEKQKELDPDYIKEAWDFRDSINPLLNASGYINALAWLFFSIPMLQLLWILSQGGTKSVGLHIAIGIMILSGGLCEWIARFLYLGSHAAAEYIAYQFNLDNWVETNDEIGWRVLEIVHVVTVGFVYFLDIFEWFVIAVCLILLFFSVRSYQATVDATVFTGFWAGLGFFVGMISLLDFIGQIVGHHGYLLFGKLSFWYTTINRLILLPIWLILLARALPYASMKLHNNDNIQNANQQFTPNYNNNNVSSYDTGVSPTDGSNNIGNNNPEPPTFTIGED